MQKLFPKMRDVRRLRPHLDRPMLCTCFFKITFLAIKCKQQTNGPIYWINNNMYPLLSKLHNNTAPRFPIHKHE